MIRIISKNRFDELKRKEDSLHKVVNFAIDVSNCHLAKGQAKKTLIFIDLLLNSAISGQQYDWSDFRKTAKLEEKHND